ncbi:MFS transporter [Aeromicrobium sp.]|uniref:MFS transporter n=1 Tax=Aeromicrobium sp. TaxID=1871063 RepID=UPI0028A9887E|nr:MFS transporter [Aeromicrobium sp.]
MSHSERDVPALTERSRRQLTAAGLALIAACYGLARFAYGVFVPAFREEFGLGSAVTGAIASGSFVSYCLAIVAASLLTPRFGGKRVAVAAGVVATVGTLTIASAPNAAVLAVGVLVAGSSTGIASPPLAHAVAHTVAERSRDRTQTVINAGTGVGIMLAAPIALLASDEWRLAWFTFALACALVTAWVAWAVPAGESGSTEGARSLLPTPLLPAGASTLLIAAVTAGFASSAVWTFGRDVLVTEGGLSEGASLSTWALLGAFGVLGATAGDLARHLGLRASWTITMLAMGAATLLMGLFPGILSIAWLAAAMFGASYIALSGLLLLWGTRVFPDSPAAGVGVAFLALALTQATGSATVGVLVDSNADCAFVITAFVAVVGGFARAPRVSCMADSPT